MRILSMSGFVPEAICDVIRFTGYTGDRNIAQYCGYANDFISQVLNDEMIDGAVFPKSCDSSRIIKSYLSDCKKFVYQFNIPTRNDAIAVNFLAKEIEDYKCKLEQYFKISINDISERIEKINKRNRQIAKYYQSLENYSYGDYIRWIHEDMKHPLLGDNTEQHIDFHKTDYTHIKKRVYLVGSFLANDHITDMIETNGLKIVGDNLPESGRIQGSNIDTTESNVYTAIAASILANRLSPTQNNFKEIIQIDMDEIKRVKADAVLFITQKYCEPYDYLYSVYKKELDKMGIPSCKISLTDSQDERKAALSIEAFSDMI